MIAEGYFELVTDLPHWAFELTVEAVTFAVGFAWGWAKIKRHVHDDIREAERRIEQHMHEDVRLGPEEWHQG